MNCDSILTPVKNPCSAADALAMKNAALRAVLGYLEHKQGPGEWYQDELTYRFHRMVELALAAPCEVEALNQSPFRSANSPLDHQS
jgi:hypothetical protein